MRLGAVCGAFVVAGLLLTAGCDSDDPEPEEPAKTRTDPKARDVAFSGDEFDGTIMFQAGERDTDMDLYRARGSLDDTRRLTTDGRISILSGAGDLLAASNARGSGGDRLEQLNPASDSPLPGKVLDPAGQAPSVSPEGKVIYTVQQYKEDGGDAGASLYVIDKPGTKRRLVYRARPGQEIDGAWGPGDKPAVTFPGRSRVLVLNEGRRESLNLGTSAFNLYLSAKGDLVAHGDGKVVVLPRDAQRREFSTSWVPLAWSPDGSRILASRRTELGLMSPGDGTVKPIGTVTGGKVNYAAWLKEDT